MQQDTAQAPGLRIYLLGPLRIERGGAAVHLPRRKVEALLAYLLLYPQPQTRDALAALFWGDTADDKARHSLRTALATLRGHLGDALLLADREQVQIDPGFPLWVDLRELLAVGEQLDGVTPIEAAGVRSALALWRGELLEGFYDEWVSATREHYHARLLKRLLDLAQALRARSEYVLAIEVAQQVLRLDATNEHAHQHLMFCYMAAGDRAAALRQYEQCERVLEVELDAPPAAETTALYLWIKGRGGETGSPAARITNLPIPLTSFVGRTQATSAVKRLLDPDGQGVRLLTLTGPGGSGKTRLAIQSATDLIDSFPAGVWFVELAALGAGDQVEHAVATALGVSEEAGKRCVHSLIDHIGDKRLLLVLDNCEHLIEPLAQMAAALLSHCPHLQILATSREPFNIGGETRWQTPALTLPAAGPAAAPDRLLETEGVRLFVERAAAVQQDFRLTAENAAAVAEICIRLDGMPLAIELAAARVRLLPVSEIAARLTSALGARFALLKGGSRAALPRQQTLRAAIDWSHDLLTPPERQLFRQLAVFRGGFTLSAVEQVAALGDGSGDALDLLTQLVDRSLVVVEPQGAAHRYHLLETLREYAFEQLAAAAELPQLQDRQAAHFLRLAEEAEPELLRRGQAAWLERLEVEHPNLRAALEHLLAQGAGEAALRLTAALLRFWDARGHVGEGREALRRALALGAAADAPGRYTAKALTAAGWLAYRQGDEVGARTALQDAAAIYAHEEEETGLVDALQVLAVIEADQGNYAAAQAQLERSLAVAGALNYAYGLARGRQYAGALAWDGDQFEDAASHYRASLELYQTLGHEGSAATLLLNLGDTQRMLGQMEAAAASYAQGLQLARSLGHKGLTGAVLKSMGMLAFKRGDYALARRHGEAALAILRELGDKPHIAFALSDLAHVARQAEQAEQALAYYSQALQIMHEVGYKWPIFGALEDIAGLLTAAGQQPQAAVRLLGAAASLRQETGIPVPPERAEEHARLLAALRWELGEDGFEAEWQAAAGAPLDQIIGEAAALRIAPASF